MLGCWGFWEEGHQQDIRCSPDHYHLTHFPEESLVPSRQPSGSPLCFSSPASSATVTEAVCRLLSFQSPSRKAALGHRSFLESCENQNQTPPEGRLCRSTQQQGEGHREEGSVTSSPVPGPYHQYIYSHSYPTFSLSCFCVLPHSGQCHPFLPDPLLSFYLSDAVRCWAPCWT